MRNSLGFRYGLAVVAYAALIATSSAFQRLWGIRLDTTALIILLMIGSAWYLGRGPGLLVALLFEATLNYFAGVPHVPPKYFITLNRLVLFCSVVIFASARRSAESRLKAHEQLLRGALEREQVARAAAEAAARAKDEFLATVSHELRTPLNAIVGWAALLNRAPVDGAMHRQGLDAIQRNAQAQTRIVNDVLEFSGMVRGRLKIEPREISLGTIVTDAVETLRAGATAKGLTLTLTIDGEVGVVADPDRVRQMAWNLVGNAIKFTNAGVVAVHVRRADGCAEVQVIDTGMGIERAFLPHVFQAFRQQDGTMTRAHGGLGLGLAIVRHLAELHGGTVVASSDGVGQGATFTLRLPSLVAEQPLASAAVGDSA